METNSAGKLRFLPETKVLLAAGATRCADTLSAHTAELHTVASSREAIISFARNRPDLVIFDLTEENGIRQAVETMRSMNPEAEFIGMVDDRSETLRRIARTDPDGVIHETAGGASLLKTLDRIAGRIRSRKEPARQKRLTELLLHGLPHPALLLEKETGTIVLANAKAENLGCAAGETCTPILLPENVTERKDVQAGFAVYSPVNIGEAEIGGRWYDVTLAPASPDMIMLFAADITRRKQLERQRRDVERVVRHDLKTPLNGIIGFSALLAEQELPQDKARTFAEQIHESSTRMLAMINGSLDISRMEQGAYVSRPELFDLSAILCRIELEQKRPFVPKKLTMKYMLGDRPLKGSDMEDGWEPIRAWGEPHHIENMLANLLLNAREAAPARSTITVAISSGPELTISISNMGTVPEEIRDRFFERYATSGKRGGTGLGTFSAKLICEAHGGDISFTSSEQDGTRVTVKLPGVPG